jgi:hypothetical protein
MIDHLSYLKNKIIFVLSLRIIKKRLRVLYI